MMQIPLTSVALTSLTNAAIALLFAVIPPLRAWFVAKSADWQTAIFGIASILLGILFMIVGCLGWLNGLTCTGVDLTRYFVGVVLAAVGGLGAAKTAFIGVRLIARNTRSGQTADKSLGVPHTERAKMLD